MVAIMKRKVAVLNKMMNNDVSPDNAQLNDYSSIMEIDVNLNGQQQVDIQNEVARCKNRISEMTSIAEDSADKNIIKLMDKLEKQQVSLVKQVSEQHQLMSLLRTQVKEI